VSRRLIYPYAGSFNGAANVVSGANTGLSGASALTMACWFNATSGVSAFQAIMALGSSGGANGTIIYLDVFSGGIGYYNHTASLNGGAPKANNWYHGALTWDGANVTVYLNAVAIGAPAALTQNLTNSKLYIGSTPAAGSFFTGLISDACLWNVGLSQAQVTALYQQAVLPSGLIRRYLLIDGSGSAPVDSSTTVNTGTSTGLAWSTNTPAPARSVAATRSVASARTAAGSRSVA
jgi:hypothetical protein